MPELPTLAVHRRESDGSCHLYEAGEDRPAPFYGHVASWLTPENADEIVRRCNGWPGLVAACGAGSPPLPEFLRWVADRFVSVLHVHPNTDFVLALREHADRLAAALAAAGDDWRTAEAVNGRR